MNFTNGNNRTNIKNVENNGNSLNLKSAELIINTQRSYLLSTNHTIKEFQTLISENMESLLLIQKTDKKMSLSAYRNKEWLILVLTYVMDHIH
jgi:hypothetical protein